MKCCDNKQVIGIMAKCSDQCYLAFPDGTDADGYVPENMNIGGGDYIRIHFCMNCGQMAGKFPVELPNKDEDED